MIAGSGRKLVFPPLAGDLIGHQLQIDAPCRYLSATETPAREPNIRWARPLRSPLPLDSPSAEPVNVGEEGHGARELLSVSASHLRRVAKAEVVATPPEVIVLPESPRTTAILPGNEGCANFQRVVIMPSGAGSFGSDAAAEDLVAHRDGDFQSELKRSTVYSFTGNQRAGYIRYAKSGWIAANLMPNTGDSSSPVSLPL